MDNEKIIAFVEGVIDTITVRRAVKVAVITGIALIATAVFKNRTFLDAQKKIKE